MENRNGHHVLLQFQSRICQLFSYFSCLFHAISSFMIKSPDVNLAVMADLPMHFGSMMSMENIHFWHVFTDFKGMKPVACEACITCNAVTLIPPSTSPNDIFMLPEEKKNICHWLLLFSCLWFVLKSNYYTQQFMCCQSNNGNHPGHYIRHAFAYVQHSLSLAKTLLSHRLKTDPD